MLLKWIVSGVLSLGFLSFGWSSYLNPCGVALTASEVSDLERTLEQGEQRGDTRRIEIKNLGIKVVKTGAQFNDIRANPLMVEREGHKIRTMMFHHKNGMVPSNAKALVVLMHGIGADISHSGAMMPIMNYLSGPKTFRQSGSTAQIHEKYLPLGVVAFDGPDNGYGPPLTEVSSLDQTLQLLKLQIEFLKQKAPHLPLIVFARSSSTGLIVAMNDRYPGLVDGLILMSPVTPEPRAKAEADEGLDADIRDTEEKVAQGFKPDFIINKSSLIWDDLIYDQMTWYLKEDPLQGVPTFVITGDQDKQTPPLTRAFYKKIALQGAALGGRYLEVKGAGHDVVSTVQRYRGDEDTLKRAVLTYHAIYDFIDQVSRSAPAPK